MRQLVPTDGALIEPRPVLGEERALVEPRRERLGEPDDALLVEVAQEGRRILETREDESLILHEHDVDELDVHDFLHFRLERGHDAVETGGLWRSFREARHEALRDERRDGFALALEKAEDEKSARARGGRLGGAVRPIGGPPPLEQRAAEARA